MMRALLFLSCVLASSVAFSWNAQGHLIVADLALGQLSPAKQRYFEQLAFRAVKQMEPKKRLYLMRTFEDTSSFAHLSVFPDDLRDRTVRSLYEEYAGELPELLAPYADTTTRAWHYTNQPYQPQDTPPNCEKDTSVSLASILPVLLEVFRDGTSEDSQALTLAFIVHLIAEAHNPLNTISKLDEDCESDRGRNKLCVAYHPGSRSCEQNLHQAWDSGIGLFDDYGSVANAVERLSNIKVDEDKGAQLDVDTWMVEGFNLARLVYAVKPGERLDPYYIEEGKIISTQRVTLAATRLAAILDQLKP